MPHDEKAVSEIIRIHGDKEYDISTRLTEFREIWESGSEEDVFAELVFCLLTPQSKAKLCWGKVERLLDHDILTKGTAEKLSTVINPIRFRHTKAMRIVEARERFGPKGPTPIKCVLQDFPSTFEAREWLVGNVNGLGYKEASHFLRNIGRGEELAILDRHILRNLTEIGVIDRIPATISRSRYLEIEKKMGRFAETIGIPLAHLDLVLWCKETGEIFK
jgi:N-glycosylase/DNA lyase